MIDAEITQVDIENLYQKLYREAEASGYHLNRDIEFTKSLVKGLLINERRYGYQSCPCRIASGVKDDDLDIICPCDYRDPDLVDYDACYCALYVSGAVLAGEKKAESILERRPPQRERKKTKTAAARSATRLGAETKLAYPVWRCKVCGYLCARDSPPEVCPICKAKKERFERFM